MFCLKNKNGKLFSMNGVADFSEELSKLKLSERPNSLFQSGREPPQHLPNAALSPSQFDSLTMTDVDSGRKRFRQNRSSISGFSVADLGSATFKQTLTVDRVTSELSEQEAASGRQCRSRIANHLLDTMPSDSKSDTYGNPSVKSWAAVLTMGKIDKQPASAAGIGGCASDRTKLSKSSSIESSPVNDPGRCRSATDDGDRTRFMSSDGNKYRSDRSSDRLPAKPHEIRSKTWTSASSEDKKTTLTSHAPQSHQAGSDATKSKQDRRGRSAGHFDGAASNSQSQTTQQKKKKKKKKSKSSGVAVDETSNALERAEEAMPLPAPEFHDLNEFPSLLSLKGASKKTPLQAFNTSFTSGNFWFHLMYYSYIMCCF